MINLKIAVRNVLRNRRRSVTTTATIALGASAILLLGALMSYIVLDFQTITVRRTGHLSVFTQGYYAYGAGDPVGFGIANYQSLMKDIAALPGVANKIKVITPNQVVFGIAGNYSANTSKTFMGQGIVPTDRATMRQWNGYGLEQYRVARATKTLQAPDGAMIGLGLGRILGLCSALQIPDCAARPVVASTLAPAAPDAERLDVFVERDSAPAAHSSAAPRIDLLAASATGAPNVVSLSIERAEFQGIKELDDNFILMQLPLAQSLLYGRGEPKVTAILLQLEKTGDIAAVSAELRRFFAARGLKLEVRDFAELTPLYRQALSFFSLIFTFVAIVIGVIVLFTIINTMGMSVLERTNEIGTSRALGVQRSAVSRQFVLEGAVLGAFGATAGVAIAAVIVLAINHAGIEWTPPTVAGKIPLQLFLFGNPLLLAGVWLVLTAVATLAALFPARRAARMPVVDALRHV